MFDIKEQEQILSKYYSKLVVYNLKTQEEIAVITTGSTPIDTISDDIVVRLTPVYED